MILSDVLTCTVPPLRVESSLLKKTLFLQFYLVSFGVKGYRPPPEVHACSTPPITRRGELLGRALLEWD